MHDILSALEVSDQATLVFWVILGLFAIVKAAESVVTIYHRTRKTPGAEQIFANKKEMDDYMRRTDHRLDAIDTELTSGLKTLAATLSAEMTSVNRSLGRLEGQIGQAIISAAAAAKTTESK